MLLIYRDKQQGIPKEICPVGKLIRRWRYLDIRRNTLLLIQIDWHQAQSVMARAHDVLVMILCYMFYFVSHGQTSN